MRLISSSSEDWRARSSARPGAAPPAGTLDRLVVESELLAGNPLGDPVRRPLWVYRPPGVELDHPRPLPVIYVIQGFTGQLDMWANRTFREPTYLERIDAMFASGDCPDALVVMVDCWTAYGGSQFLDSIGTGRYQSYMCDEIVPFVDSRATQPQPTATTAGSPAVVRRIRRDGRADDAARRLLGAGLHAATRSSSSR